MTGHTSQALESLAFDILEISKVTWSDAQKGKPDGRYDLSETEFLTLDALEQDSVLTVGELQQRIRVLPAQMSRIIKSLEARHARPLVHCSINPDDKRRVDVRLTDAGREATKAFRRSKIDTTAAALKVLSPEDIEHLRRIVGILRDTMIPGG
jgi:DNA-binding MarR family transcriptional regulator